MLLAAQTSPGSGHKILIEAARLLSRSGLAGVKFILACDGKGGALARGIDRAIATEGLQGIMYRAGPCDMPAALSGGFDRRCLAERGATRWRRRHPSPGHGNTGHCGEYGAAPETILAPPMVEESARTGFLVPPGDAAALALAIASVLSLGATAGGKLSLRAKKHVETCFSAEHMCAETLEAYVDVRRGGDDGRCGTFRPATAVRWQGLGVAVFSPNVQAISSLTSRRNPPMFQTGPAVVAKTAQAKKAPAGFDLST